MNEPRILFLDIETLPNILTSWGLKIHSGYISHDNILQERTILCAAWKWAGVKRVRSIAVRPGSGGRADEEDRRILKRLSHELSLADAVVTHNGDNFDMKWIRARLVILGMPPHKPVIQIDTKKIAKAHFYFNSNRLDYLGKAMKLGAKIKTEFDLWLDCLTHRDVRTRRKALRKMIAYNKQDVILLEKIFNKMRPFVVAKLNRAQMQEDEDVASRTCPTCGEDKLIVKGVRYSRTTKRRELRCSACGAWSYRISTSSVPR